MLAQYEEIRYKDSGRVLKAIREIIDRHEELVTPLLGSVSPAGDEYGRIAVNTLSHIREEIDNAPTSKKIWVATKAAGEIPVDPRRQ